MADSAGGLSRRILDDVPDTLEVEKFALPADAEGQIPDDVSKLYFKLYTYIEATYGNKPEPFRRLLFSTAYAIYSKRKKAEILDEIAAGRHNYFKIATAFYHRDRCRVLCDEAKIVISAAFATVLEPAYVNFLEKLQTSIRESTDSAILSIRNAAVSDLGGLEARIGSLIASSDTLKQEIVSLEEGVNRIKSLTAERGVAPRRAQRLLAFMFYDVILGGVKETWKIFVFVILVILLGVIIHWIVLAVTYFLPTVGPVFSEVGEHLYIGKIRDILGSLLGISK